MADEFRIKETIEGFIIQKKDPKYLKVLTLVVAVAGF